MSVLGIDFGTHSFVCGSITGGNIDILRNELSERLAPIMITYDTKQRHFGTAAQGIYKTRLKDTVYYVRQLLGISSDNNDVIKREKQFIPTNLLTDKPYVSYNVPTGLNNSISPIEVTASIIKDTVNKFAKYYNKNFISVVVSHPGWFLDVHKSALIQALDLCGIHWKKIMSQTRAAALSYGILRSRELSATAPQFCVIISVGADDLQGIAVDFYSSKMEILSEFSTPECGGRDLTHLICVEVIRRFAEKYNLKNFTLKNLRDRSLVRLEDTVKKVKHILSANEDALFSMECLHEDYDFSTVIKRAEFEELCELELLPKMRHILSEFAAKLPLDRLKKVEIIGATTRVPIIQKLISEQFATAELSKTMNADEAVAQGLTIVAASLSPTVRLKPYSYSEHLKEPIKASLPADSSKPVRLELMKNDETIIWKEQIPVTPTGDIYFPNKSYPFNSILHMYFFGIGQIHIRLEYDTMSDQLYHIINPFITDAKVIKPGNAQSSEYRISIKVDQNGVIRISEICSVKRQVIVEKIPEAEQTEDNKESERTVNRVTLEPLEFTQTTHACLLSPIEADEFRKYEKIQTDVDEKRIRICSLRNSIESLTYEIDEKLRTEWSEYASGDDSKMLSEAALQAQEWLDNENPTELSPYEELQNRLLDLTNPVVRRFKERDMCKEFINQLSVDLNSLIHTIESNQMQSEDFTNTEIPQDIVEQTKSQLMEYNTQLSSTPKMVNLAFTAREIQDKSQNIQKMGRKIMKYIEAKSQMNIEPPEGTGDPEKNTENNLDSNRQGNAPDEHQQEASKGDKNSKNKDKKSKGDTDR